MTPLVSVIVPNYNHAAFLKQRIDSILNQSFQDFELILLDDCSTDNSREILSSYKENPHVSHFICNKTNSGSPFAQWNKGIELAQGEWVWIAESDDWAYPDFLEVTMRQSVLHPNCGIIYTLAHFVYEGQSDWTPPHTGEIHEYNGVEFNKDKLLFDNVIYNVSMTIIKRALFCNVNFEMSSQMHRCGDWLLYSQIANYTNVLSIDEPHSYFRRHHSSTSSSFMQNTTGFQEEMMVTRFIANMYHIPQSKYAKIKGKEWAKAQGRYHYNPKEEWQLIKNELRIGHYLVVLFFLAYCLKYKCQELQS